MKTIDLNTDTRVLDGILNNAERMGIPVAMKNGKILYRKYPGVFAVEVQLIIPDNVSIKNMMP